MSERAKTNPVTTLSSMLDKTVRLLEGIGEHQLELPTPCAEYDVDRLLDHLAIWVQVFDAAVNDRELAFDPTTHRVAGDRTGTFRRSAQSIVDGLERNGWERPMTMTADPIPGQLVLDMLLMEYVGHGWDVARATGQAVPFDDGEATTALDAARTIVAPEYRGPGMFDTEVPVAGDAPAVDRFIAFTGRDPAWSPASAACR